ncbi:DgyrCDS3272 [Dimorphilus gyrociliatus]|nr:DgyrCDS3272 [Dimorphilus gyrociliatus]
MDAWSDFDKNNDGVVSIEEAFSVLSTLFGFSKAKIRKLLRSCDKDRDGSLNYSEFTRFYAKIKEERIYTQEIFAQIDTNHDGFVTKEEIQVGLRHMALSEDDVSRIMSAFDMDQNGILEFNEFARFWQS